MMYDRNVFRTKGSIPGFSRRQNADMTMRRIIGPAKDITKHSSIFGRQPVSPMGRRGMGMIGGYRPLNLF